MAASIERIDFEEICKKYYELIQAEFDHVDKMNKPPRPIVAFIKEEVHNSHGNKPTAKDIDLRHVKLEVQDLRWKEDSGQIEPVQKISKLRYENPKSEPDVFAQVKATPELDATFKVVITKGLWEDFGRTLSLPLPKGVKDSRSHIEINPSQAETKQENKMLLEVTLGRETLPKEGATAVVKSEKKTFEGTFTCKVYPRGKVMIDLKTNPSIQDVIRTLKDHKDEQVNNLVSPFDAKGKNPSPSSNDKMDMEQESIDEVDISDKREFYWKLEGYGDFQWDCEHTMLWDVDESKGQDQSNPSPNDSGNDGQ